MNTNEAVEYLKRYQLWRRGEDGRTMDDAGLDPTTIGNAIDKVLLDYELSKTIYNCLDVWNDDGPAEVKQLLKVMRITRTWKEGEMPLREETE